MFNIPIPIPKHIQNEHQHIFQAGEITRKLEAIHLKCGEEGGVSRESETSENTCRNSLVLLRFSELFFFSMSFYSICCFMCVGCCWDKTLHLHIKVQKDRSEQKS